MKWGRGRAEDEAPTTDEPDPDAVRMTAWVHGFVQGVGFRWWTRSQALELGLVGSRISAQRALELGLVNRVVPRGEAVAEALVLAEAIAANGPLAVRLTKQLAYAQEDDVSPALWTKIDEVTHTVMNSDDAKEGARAFVEKRSPNWTGR